MDPSSDSSSVPAQAMQSFATQLRKSAEAAIVKAFRESLEGQGTGPTDADLKLFARLAAYEMKLERRAAEQALMKARARDAIDQPTTLLVSRAEIAASSTAMQSEAPRMPAASAANARAPSTAVVAAAAATYEPAAVEVRPSAPTPAPRRKVSLAVLASSGLLLVCAALTSWMVGTSSGNWPAARLASTAPIDPPKTIDSSFANAADLVSSTAQHAKAAIDTGVLAALPAKLSALEHVALQSMSSRIALARIDTSADASEMANSIALPEEATATRDTAEASAGTSPRLREQQRAFNLRKAARRTTAPVSHPPTNATTVRSDMGWTTVASCGALNFFSRAICVNNACATPGLKRSASCSDAVRQRRIDEARRNLVY